MNNFVFMGEDGVPIVSSFVIADGVGNPHKSVIQLIRQNIEDLEEFGRVAFEMRPFETAGGTQQREIALLNEQQSTLLLTYMRNNDVVRAFKKRLVKAFYELVRQKRQSQPVTNFPNPKVQALLAREARLQFKMFSGIAKGIGLEGNQAILSATSATQRLTGVFSPYLTKSPSVG